MIDDPDPVYPGPMFAIVCEGEVYEVESLSWSSLVVSSPIRQPRPFIVTPEGFTELSDADVIPF